MVAAPPGVLHLIYSLVAGGAESLTAELAEGSARAGWRCRVCAWRKGGPTADRLARAGIPTSILALPRRSLLMAPLALWDLLRILAAVRGEVLRHDAVIIHAHLGDSALLAVLVARWCRWRGHHCRVVVTHHSSRSVPAEIPEGSLKWHLRRVLFSWTVKRIDRAIAISAEVAEALAAQGTPAERIRTVVNGVVYPPPLATRPRPVLREELGISSSAPLIVCVGRLASGKGQGRLIAAMSRVLERIPQAVLLLVGDGPDREALTRSAATLPSGTVVFTGARADVGDVLLASDVFATGSSFEGVSLALLEAQARGLPCVSTDCVGNRDLLADGRGLLVPLDDAQALAEVLVRALTDVALRARLAEVGRAQVAASYCLDHTVAATLSVYGELLQEHTA